MLNREFKRLGPAPRPVDTFAHSTPEHEAEAIRKRKQAGNHPPKQTYRAFREDGSEVTFVHPVDYVQALLSGKFTSAAQPEVPAAIEIEGVEPISKEVIEDVEDVKKS